MKKSILALSLLALVGLSASAETIKVCRDADGKMTFTDTTCADMGAADALLHYESDASVASRNERAEQVQTTKRGGVSAPPVPRPLTMLEEYRIKQGWLKAETMEERRREQGTGSNHLERTAARNARVTANANAHNWDKRSQGTGYALDYNAAMQQAGGKGRLPVPPPAPQYWRY